MDVFSGPAAFARFSARLAEGERVSDEEVAEVLGSGVVKDFRFIANRLAGRVRKVTDAPTLSHSADIAVRAKYLGFPQDYVSVCLLHDMVEESSEDLEDVSLGLREATDRFGDEVARDIRILTNRYSIILDTVANRVPRKLPFEYASLALVREQIAQLYRELPDNLQREFGHEFSFLLDYFIDHLLDSVNLADCKNRARRDHKYTFLDELTLQAYNVYIIELADDACKRLDSGKTRFYNRAIVAKALDVVDNQRTASLTLPNLKRVQLKAEIWLDRCYYINGWLCGIHHNTSAFEYLYDYVKLQMIQQAIERKDALGRLADTRFKRLADHLAYQIARLSAKYCVSEPLIDEINHLTKDIRARNG